VLQPRHALGMFAQVRGQTAHNGVEDRDAGDAEFVRTFLQTLAHFFIDEGENDGAGIGLYLCNDFLELFLGAHQRPEFLYRLYIFELGEAGTRQTEQRCARRIGYKMDVEFFWIWSIAHDYCPLI